MFVVLDEDNVRVNSFDGSLLVGDPSAEACSCCCCCLLSIRVFSRRSSSSLISGLFMSRGLPVPNMLAFLPKSSWSLGAGSAGFVRGNRLSGLRPSVDGGGGIDCGLDDVVLLSLCSFLLLW